MANKLAENFGNIYKEFLKHFTKTYKHPLEVIKEKMSANAAKEISVTLHLSSQWKNRQNFMQMLSIGAGNGHFEMNLMNQCAELDVKVMQFDLYEPDPIHFNMIKEWSKTLENVKVIKEIVKEDTKYPRKYNWIILRHVCYYFLTEVIKCVLPRRECFLKSLISHRNDAEIFLKALFKHWL